MKILDTLNIIGVIVLWAIMNYLILDIITKVY
jgi:hypothetical protein